MNANQDKILLPNDVRKLLNVDNKEIVELCKKTSVNPKKNSKGQIYFSVDEVKKLRNAKSSIVSEMNEKKSALSLITKPNSQVVVNNLLETLSNMENNITESPSSVFINLNRFENTQRLEKVMRYVMYKLTDEDILTVQRFANRILKAKLKEDGRYGSKTANAVKKLQKKWKLPQDGMPDYQLLYRIKNFKSWADFRVKPQPRKPSNKTKA